MNLEPKWPQTMKFRVQGHEHTCTQYIARKLFLQHSRTPSDRLLSLVSGSVAPIADSTTASFDFAQVVLYLCNCSSNGSEPV